MHNRGHWKQNCEEEEFSYKVFGGLSFYRRKEIKDVVSYMKLAINAADEEALTRVINYPARGIGKTSIQKLTAFAANNGVSLLGSAHQN